MSKGKAGKSMTTHATSATRGKSELAKRRAGGRTVSTRVRYRSAIDRLRELGPVFSGRELLVLHMGWNSARASQYLYRWRMRGLIHPLGGKSDVYFNLLREGDWRDHIPEALARVYPTAVLIGPRPLHQAGWITQPVEILDVAVPPRAPRYQIASLARVHERPLAWFRCLPEMPPPVGALRQLPPAWALADMRVTADPASPDEDDIYFSLFTPPERRELKHATEILGGALNVHPSTP